MMEIELAWQEHAERRRGAIPLSGEGRRALLQRLAGAQNWRCCHCGVRTNEALPHTPRSPTIEHIVPRALGGDDEESNLAMACAGCNQARGHDPDWTAPGKSRG